MLVSELMRVTRLSCLVVRQAARLLRLNTCFLIPVPAAQLRQLDTVDGQWQSAEAVRWLARFVKSVRRVIDY
jgi:hypothetical protein